jgi:putative PIN family toxin of toxin-antitoxin system
MRVVADTNVVVSGLLWRGNQRRVLDAARDRIIKLFTSIALPEELEDVLSRERFTPRLEAAKVTARELVLGYAALATVVEAAPIEPVILADSDDAAVPASRARGSVRSHHVRRQSPAGLEVIQRSPHSHTIAIIRRALL